MALDECHGKYECVFLLLLKGFSHMEDYTVQKTSFTYLSIKTREHRIHSWYKRHSYSTFSFGVWWNLMFELILSPWLTGNTIAAQLLVFVFYWKKTSTVSKDKWGKTLNLEASSSDSSYKVLKRFVFFLLLFFYMTFIIT